MRNVLKKLGDGLAAVLVWPVGTFTRVLMRTSSDPDRVLAWSSQWASSWVGPVGDYARRALYVMLLEDCADDVCICYGTVFSRRNTRLGRRVYMGVSCNIGLAHIQDDVLLGSAVHILSGKRQHFFHRDDTPIREQGGEYVSVTVGSGTWIGNGALVLADVGRECVVGAGSVVIKPVPDGALVGGNPARVLGYRRGFGPGGKSSESDASSDREISHANASGEQLESESPSNG